MSVVYGFLSFVLLLAASFAGEVNLPYTFQPNTPARAEEVNANFNAVRDAVNDNNSRIQQLQQQVQNLQNQVQSLQNLVTQLQNRIQALENSNVMAMDSYIEVMPDPNVSGGTLIRFSGVNLQIVNGTGQTDQVNGLGNLIIGYNTARQDTPLRDTCSLGQYWNNETDCRNNGGIWGKDFKTGSHNLIVGDQNAYSSYGGIVAGFGNVISREYATVTGGRDNISAGPYSSVSGGPRNTASGWYSSVSGGRDNTASGWFSSVSGGLNNTASGSYSSVSGGYSNTAYGRFSSVSGGRNNTAVDPYSAISGGAGCDITDDGINNTKWGAKATTGSVGDCS
ncbi:MAG TPA: hypothetical protein ENJ61_07820 [Aquifex aeolicus]|uniref:Uncharacterized protein n=1 Tax=Aquifex aeolicus TaxID=63363 RepID=A0A7C5Q988_AQUAO|nr:hypothetical protein [Aquifex aeolicus]